MSQPLKHPKGFVESLMDLGETDAFSGSYMPAECEAIREEVRQKKAKAIAYIQSLNKEIRQLRKQVTNV